MFKKSFSQDQLVKVHKLGDDATYRGKIVGHSASGLVDFYIVKLIDDILGYNWTHGNFPEACLDAW